MKSSATDEHDISNYETSFHPHPQTHHFLRHLNNDFVCAPENREAEEQDIHPNGDASSASEQRRFPSQIRYGLQSVNTNVENRNDTDVTFVEDLDNCGCAHNCCRFLKSSKSTRILCDRNHPTSCPDLHTLLSWVSCPLSVPLFDCRFKNRYRRRLANENLLVLSIIQVLCGFASIILASVALTKAVFLYNMATGIWVGFLMLITGTQGLITSRRPITCTLIGLLVLCVVTTLASCLLIGVSVAGTIEDGFLYQDKARSKSVHHVIRLTFSYTDDNRPLKNIHPHTELPTHLNWTSFNHPRGLPPGYTLRPAAYDSHLRTCQVILHVLLLLVGILNCSVSLSTSVLCGRFVCSRSRRPNNRNLYVNRTNIVSFDNTTASQAAHLLQSCNVRPFIGSGNVLLAVAPDSLRRHESNLIGANNKHTRPSPCLHHTVSPFLPESSRSALILTQAGTGAMAWTAAHAAASLLQNNQSQVSTSLSSELHNCSSGSNSSRLRSHISKQRRPRLMFTSLNIDSTGNPNAPPYPSSSTMLYVMPSPNADDPPLIFPPFPPPYSALQKRPSISVFSRTPDTRVTCRHNRRPSRQSSDIPISSRGSSTSFLSRILPTSNRPSISRNRRRCAGARAARQRTTSSALMCAVDRFLQPVLIVGDPETSMSPHCGKISDPPAYASLYPENVQQTSIVDQ